jgi:hypothetical protein
VQGCSSSGAGKDDAVETVQVHGHECTGPHSFSQYRTIETVDFQRLTPCSLSIPYCICFSELSVFESCAGIDVNLNVHRKEFEKVRWWAGWWGWLERQVGWRRW